MTKTNKFSDIKKKDEYEVLDDYSNSENQYPIYPFTKDKNAALQEMNYKDCLNKCEGNLYNALGNPEITLNRRATIDLENPQSTSNTRTAISVGINVSSKILGLLGVPFAAQIGQLWNFILDSLWPTGGDQWAVFMQHVEELINQKIEVYAKSKAISELEGLGNNLYLYQQALNEWKQDPTNPATKDRVIQRFRIVDGLFEQCMPSFRVQNHEVPLLSVYAAAANLHLILLRDSSVHGEGWGLTQTNIKENYERQLSRAQTYANHCVTWYQTGLNKLRGSNAVSWVNYNTFRRDMTIMALDVIALFPLYDIHRYPMEVQTELTREIYTDPVGVSNVLTLPTWSNNAPSFSEIESSAISPPRVVTSIYYNRVYRGRLNGWSSGQDYWGGHWIVNETASYGDSVVTGNYGITQFPGEYTDVFIRNLDVYSVSSAAVSQQYPTSSATMFGVPTVHFDSVDTTNNTGKRVSYERPINFGGKWIYSYLPGETSDVPTVNDYSHKLTYVTSFKAGNAGSVLCYGWTHKSANRRNILASDKITQIPAVKASTNLYPVNCKVIRSKASLYSGGDVMELTRGGGTFQIDVYPTQQLKSYRMRLRYAVGGAQSVSLTISGNNQSMNHQTVTLPSTTSNSILTDTITSKDFGYIDVPLPLNITYADRAYTIEFKRNDSTSADCILDKIEFIPS